MANPYITNATLKTRLGISDTVDDTTITAVIEAVSRTIDDYCNRYFYKNSVDETRYFTARYADRLNNIADLLTVTTLTTDDAGARTYTTSWATTDYDLEPYNSALDSLPYTMIRVTPQGRYRFPGVEKGVKIVGVFGWTAVPAQIQEACCIQSERIFRRKDAPFGIAGSGNSTADFGAVRLLAKLDPDVEFMIAGFRRLLVG